MGLKLTLSIQSIKRSKNNIKEELFYELERFIYETTNIGQDGYIFATKHIIIAGSLKESEAILVLVLRPPPLPPPRFFLKLQS